MAVPREQERFEAAVKVIETIPKNGKNRCLNGPISFSKHISYCINCQVMCACSQTDTHVI